VERRSARRSAVTLREATGEDAPFLAHLWSDGLRRGERSEQETDLAAIIEASAVNPEQRLVIAEYDGVPAGAVLLMISTISPLNLERCVQVYSPTVAAAHRRHGLGHALMESAVAFAEEWGIPSVATAVTASSRDANRFMARLALAPSALLRMAPTAAVRARINAERPVTASAGAPGRQLTRVLAARRSMRRSLVD